MLKGADVFIKAFEILSEAIEIYIKGVYTFNRGFVIIGEAFDTLIKAFYFTAKGFERIGKAKTLATPRTKSSTFAIRINTHPLCQNCKRTCLYATHRAANSKRKAKKCPLLKN